MKRLVALFLALLLSIDSFAAIVGDNDGAAFITKAEFDSLKNTFQAQIDQYNSSIDNKIDGAIGSYLSGVKVSKQTVQKPLVEKYKDLYWCHDFDIVAIKSTWTAMNTNTDSAKAVVQPDYSNRVGWTYYMNNRGIRTTIYDNNLWGAAVFPVRFNFESDNDGPTRNSVRQGGDNGMSALCLNLSKDWVLIGDKALVNYNRLFYLWDRFGHHVAGRGAQPSDGIIFHLCERDGVAGVRLSLEPVAQYSEDYITLHVHGRSNSNYWGWERISWNTSNTEVAPACVTDYSTTKAIYENSTKVTFPLYTYRAPTNAQVTADMQRIANMMLGIKSTYKMPMIFDLKPGGRIGQIAFCEAEWGGTTYDTDDFPDTAAYSFPDWSKWNTRSIDCTLSFPDTYTYIRKITSDTEQGGFTSHTIPIELYSSTNSKVNVSMPVLTLFDMYNVKSPTAIYQNKNLNICGGIPLIDDVQENGSLQVKLKCEKKYDDVSATSDPSNCNAHIKFKKSDFTNTNSDYCTGTYTGHTSSVTFDDTQTIDIDDKTFTLDMQNGDSVWMSIDPITLGQHIRIKEMTVTFISE